MRRISQSVTAAVIFLGVIWAVYLMEVLSPIYLQGFGIRPRSISGLTGIPFAPFLHVNVGHIAANSIPLFTLLVIAFMFDYLSTFVAMAIIVVVGGMGTWLFGAPYSVHMGASSLIFGLIGYLISCGWYRGNMTAIVVSIAVLVLYGGSLLSLLMVMPGISWTGHFFGFIGGVCAARLMKISADR